MYSEEETELRDLIMQNLENCGFLNKIKAELRAGVFLALEEDGNLKNKIPMFNRKFDDFINTSEGKLIISLIHEFLEYFSLNFTLSVFDPEVAAPFSYISRSDLCDMTNLKTSEVDGPVISALLKEVETRRPNFSGKSSDEHNPVTEKSIKSVSNENMTDKVILEGFFNREKSDLNEKPCSSLENDCNVKSSKDNLDPLGKKADTENNEKEKVISDIFIEKSNPIKNDSDVNDAFKDSNDALSTDRDPFFDEPLPSEKTFFTFSEPLKDKSESKSTLFNKKDSNISKKSSLSSLKDLPSLTAHDEWTYRDPKNTLPSLDSLRSVSSSEASNEEIINLDPRDAFEKNDIAESNEESSEKQNSEESIAEEIDESSAGYDDLLASSLSLADDMTTDQTVSQVSVVEGVDHVEPCK